MNCQKCLWQIVLNGEKEDSLFCLKSNKKVIPFEECNEGVDMGDNVNHPAHYNKGGIECIDALKACMSEEEFIGFCKGNIIKYLWRFGAKDEVLQESKKALWYLTELIKILEK